MPFKKRADGKFVSPSGKVFTKEQVRLYHANNGFPKNKRKKRKSKKRKRR